VPVDADPAKAEEGVQGLKRTTEATKPVVTVDANTQAAIGTMVLLKVLATLLAPTVTVTANVQPAIAAMAPLDDPRRAVIDVSAPNAANVSRQLDDIANKQRTAAINVTTTQTTVLKRVDGGGP
jgi:hypothetical protein